MSSNKANFGQMILPWFICIIATIFYCYAYMLRVYPSVMEVQLRHHFLIDATAFGTLTAFYYYAYTPMQLFVGLILDRFGARQVLTIACAVATLGLFTFMSSKSLAMAEAGRLLLGAGAAFAYVTSLKLATLWLPPKRFAMMAGLTTSVGMFAAGFGDIALSKLVNTVGFVHALHVLLVIGIALTVVAIVFVRNAPKITTDALKHAQEKVHFKELIKSLGRMFTKPQMWVIGLIGMILYMPASIFLDTWGIPYLETAYHLTPATATKVILMVFIGWVLSSPILGSISDKIGLRRPLLAVCSAGAALMFAIVLYLPGIPTVALAALLFLLGAFAGVHPLCFALSRENNPIKLSGTSVALTNAFIMIGGFFQPVIGALLDWNWAGKVEHGIRLYNSHDFQIALSVLPIGLLVVSLLTFLLKETHCKVMFSEGETTDTGIEAIPADDGIAEAS